MENNLDLTLDMICRACMAENVKMRSIFEPDENLETNIHLSEMIMAYASVQVNVDKLHFVNNLD